MDIAAIPIVKFMQYCKAGAREKGYYWIACIICRDSDSEQLYEYIKRDWQSLDSITGKRLLVLLSGNEDPYNALITDTYESYVKKYTPFATFIAQSPNLKADLTSARYQFLKKNIDTVESSQTDAVAALMEYFKIEECQIPCLVYTPLYVDRYPFDNIVVPIPSSGVDIYRYFKEIFNEISPKIGCLYNEQDDLAHRIDMVYDDLMHSIEDRTDRDLIIQAITEMNYYKCETYIRRRINQYIDLCKHFKHKYGIDFSPHMYPNAVLLKEIEDVLKKKDVCENKVKPINVCLNVGNNNSFKNSPINIMIPYNTTSKGAL